MSIKHMRRCADIDPSKTKATKIVRRTCEVCGVSFLFYATADRVRRNCGRCCGRPCAQRLAARSPARRAYTDSIRGSGSRGYVKQGGRHQHRVVAEQKIGRPLLPGEVVHHINGDKRDNRPENLVVMKNQGEHCRAHGFGGKRKGG